VLISARPANFRQPREQLVLAVETAIRIVLHVIGIVEFVRLDVLVRDPEASRYAVRGGFRPMSVTGVLRPSGICSTRAEVRSQPTAQTLRTYCLSVTHTAIQIDHALEAKA
jgi:hypothetical protein